MNPRSIIFGRLLAPLLSLSVLAGCPDDTGADGSGDDTTSSADAGSSTEAAPFSEDDVIAQGMAYAADLEKINIDPVGSAHGLADTVNVFITPAAADLYRTIDPAAPADVGFPEGTLIVKEHLDAGGSPDGFLMMYRGPDGYSPVGGDWFWARIDGTGNAPNTGAVGFCIDCHEPTPGWVFGVPADNQL